MNSVRVSRTRFDGRRASVEIDIAGEVSEVSLTADRVIRAPIPFGDVWSLVAIFPAMRLGIPLELEEPVSRPRREGLVEAQRLLASWDEHMSVQPVIAPDARWRPQRRRPPMQLMTGGVDSAYAFATHPDVADLMYVHDAVHEPRAVGVAVTAQLESLASALNRRLTRVHSDVRNVVDQYAEWGTQTHGALLAAAAQFVAGGTRTLNIAATHTLPDLSPWGSHVDLDHHFSSGTLNVEHVGAEVSRPAKVKALADEPVLLAHLRVCFQSPDSLNCSRCEKCLRTMVALELAGALSKAPTFDLPLTIESLNRVPIRNDNERGFVAENVRAAIEAGRTDIADALQVSIARYDLEEREP